MANDMALKAPARMAREVPHTVSPGLWALAWKRLKSDHVGMVSLAIVAVFIAMMIASGTGLIAGDWSKETGVTYAPPSFLGADIEGGAPAAPVATFLGTVFGAVAGYYGKWADDAFNWFYSVFNSIPYLLLILAVAAVLQQKGTLTIILILGLTGWTGTFRLIRGEYLKHKAREYVQAADAIGASNSRRMFVHIFPNVSHVVLVQLSIYTVGFIKAEVILSFLGFGVPVDVVSWGSMLNEAQNELILGKWWQLAAAGTAMAILVTAFSLFTDALRDALDPKLKGLAGA